MATRQQTFNRVVKHLLTQKKRCTRGGKCRYRIMRENGPDLTCSAGCLIPRRQYRPEFEGQPLINALGKPHLAGAVIERLGHDLSLVYDLQTVHDEHEPRHWPRELAALAARENLKFNPPKVSA